MCGYPGVGATHASPVLLFGDAPLRYGRRLSQPVTAGILRESSGRGLCRVTVASAGQDGDYNAMQHVASDLHGHCYRGAAAHPDEDALAVREEGAFIAGVSFAVAIG